jgi:hypothetical protein
MGGTRSTNERGKKFIHNYEEKKGFGRLHLRSEDNIKIYIINK